MNTSTVPERSSLKAFALNKETLRTFTQTVRGSGSRRYEDATASCAQSTGSTCTSGDCCCCAALED